MRIFLDANVLFSASQTAGAVRQLLHAMQADGHTLVADEYVATEARRNLAAKAHPQSQAYLQTLLEKMEVSPSQYPARADSDVLWLPEKDRPVLMAAIGLGCDALLTGDRTHFGTGYGQTFDGVTIYAPAQLAEALFAPRNRV